MSASVLRLLISEDLNRKLEILRVRRPDLRADISCYVLFIRGVRFPEERLLAFGAVDEGKLSRMVAAVSAELAKLEAEEPLKG